MEWLQLRKRADKSGPPPKFELGPDASEDEIAAAPGSWPLACVELLGEAPTNAQLSTGYVAQAQAEGWVQLEGLRLVEDESGLWAHADTVVLELANATLRYQVVENPGRVDDADAPGGYRVEHQYTLRLEEAG